jgi:glucoamylase
VGERGHLALQAGEDPIEYLRTMWNCASLGGLLPEQVWDAEPIPALGLAPGRPSGSAMPLLWAHAEFLKLLVARERGQPIEQLRLVTDRYAGSEPPVATAWHWRDEVPVFVLESGRDLLIEDCLPFTLHLGFDGWHAVRDEIAQLQPFGLWGVRLKHQELGEYLDLDFTRQYASGWEGADHRVHLARTPVDHALPHVG